MNFRRLIKSKNNAKVVVGGTIGYRPTKILYIIFFMTNSIHMRICLSIGNLFGCENMSGMIFASKFCSSETELLADRPANSDEYQ